MCMICKGLERNKFSPEEAREKLEEFVDLDLLDEDHQEEVESLIAEAEEEQYYWSNAQKDASRHLDEGYDVDEYVDEEPAFEEDYFADDNYNEEE